MFIIVFPAPTTAVVAKQVFDKHLSRERRSISRIGKDGTHTSFWYMLVKMYSKQLREETKGQTDKWHL